MPSWYLHQWSQYFSPITKLWSTLLRLPLNLAWELLQSALSGRNGLELALIYLSSTKLGFVCAQVLRKRLKDAKYFIRREKSDITFVKLNELKGKVWKIFLSVNGKIVKRIHKAPCLSVNKSFLLFVIEKGIKQ